MSLTAEILVYYENTFFCNFLHGWCDLELIYNKNLKLKPVSFNNIVDSFEIIGRYTR